MAALITCTSSTGGNPMAVAYQGDSLSRNQWESLLCLLYTAVPGTKYTQATSGDVSTFTFTAVACPNLPSCPACPGGLPPAVSVVKKVLGTMKKPVQLLDITNLSLLRKDGHPSIYGLGGRTGMDCSHWCLAGVPDTWNQILYSLII
ncbi:hypothetical protein DH2020_008509 [Rehmannia glutinosa]|uniref:Trichome birefringence-like C-terminal domain-containing protein n=1 Tax=Rehmannia glutinosa TaxID=99300 RepID=A0ABR0X653_REHGL